MLHFISGAAGFIGSNLVDALLERGENIVGFDNFSTGQEKFLCKALKNPNFNLIRGDLLDIDALNNAVKGAGIIWHLAANADVRFGLNHPRKDLEQNTIATANVLEAARLNNIKEIYFSSTGSVYGDTEIIPTPENAPFPIQTSLYGASKLACEALIAAYCEGFGMRGRVFRFVSILGERYTHGHVFDFVKKLSGNSEFLEVLGDGKQRKSYLYVKDCISAMIKVYEKSSEQGSFDVFNLGVDSFCEVKDSVGWITDKLGLNPTLRFLGGKRGWIGDNPFIYLETSKIRSLGWKEHKTSRRKNRRLAFGK